MDYFSYRFNKNKKILFYIGAPLIFSLAVAVFFIFSGNGENKEGDSFGYTRFSSPETQSKEDLFLSPSPSLREYPELTLVQNNSLAGGSSPLLINPQVLAMKTQEELAASEYGKIIEYVVEKGDTLSGVAQKFNISLNTVLWANNLYKNSKINPGRKLTILPVSGVMYLVKKGDTLGRIARNYNGEIEEMIVFNNLPSAGNIYIGDILIIPGGKMPSVLPAYSVPFASSYFIFPCKGRISQGPHFYNAIDVANKCGTPIYAAAEGTVQRALTKEGPITGKFVRILHPNGIVTYYGHLSRILVGVGQKVSQGTMIGYMGETGHATGCHLHFDVRNAVNPLAKYSVGSYLGWK